MIRLPVLLLGLALLLLAGWYLSTGTPSDAGSLAPTADSQQGENSAPQGMQLQGAGSIARPAADQARTQVPDLAKRTVGKNSLLVRVLDADGEPVPDFELIRWKARQGVEVSERMHVQPVGKTNQRGEYMVRQTPTANTPNPWEPGAYWGPWQLSPAEPTLQHLAVTMLRKNSPCTLVLPPLAPIDFFLAGHMGAPYMGAAQLEFYFESMGKPLSLSFEAGQTRVERVPVDVAYRFSVVSDFDGIEPTGSSTNAGEAGAARRHELRLRLNQACEISFQLKLPDGSLAADMVFECPPKDFWAEPLRTDMAGIARVPLFYPDSGGFEVRCGKYRAFVPLPPDAGYSTYYAGIVVLEALESAASPSLEAPAFGDPGGPFSEDDSRSSQDD